MSLKAPQDIKDRGQSPAYIAAAIAATKFSPVHTGQDVSQAKPSQKTDAKSRASRTENISIPSTNTLIKLFEAKEDKARETHITRKTSSETRIYPLIASPAPIRPTVSVRLIQRPIKKYNPFTDGGSDQKEGQTGFSETVPEKRTATKQVPPSSSPLQPIDRVTHYSTCKDQSEPRLTRRNTHPPILISEVDKDDYNLSSSTDETSSSSSYTSALTSPLTRSKGYTQISSNDVSVRPPPVRTKKLRSAPSKIVPLTGSPSSTGVSARPPATTSSSRIDPRVDAMANAIVAGSLAASRAPSPTKEPEPGMIRRRSNTHALFHHHDASSRTPSPAKTLRKTLRTPREDSETRHKKPHPLRKHPNKHAEGDRKRWRDEISGKERQRYEEIWASNRGFLVTSSFGPSTDTSSDSRNLVCNLVVRDIWSRSQLSFAILAEIWELVDRRGDGTLGREEWVVGMWLIDQCLKGRKLPVRVSESVWSSVRRLSGVTIPPGPYR